MALVSVWPVSEQGWGLERHCEEREAPHRLQVLSRGAGSTRVFREDLLERTGLCAERCAPLLERGAPSLAGTADLIQAIANVGHPAGHTLMKKETSQVFSSLVEECKGLMQELA